MIVLLSFALVLVALCSVAVWTFIRFREAGLLRRAAMALLPLSQAAIVATLCAFAVTSDLDAAFSLALSLGSSCAGVACAIVDVALFGGAAVAGERELEEERARFLEEELVEQEGRLVGARAEADRAEELRQGFEDRLCDVERELREGDSSKLVRSLDDARDALGAGVRRYCAHRIADAIIATKAREFEDAGIAATFRLDVPSDLPYSNVDVCALFSNVLDNALHACEQVEPGSRFVEARARAASGLFVLEVRNARAGSAVSTDSNERSESPARLRQGSGERADAGAEAGAHANDREQARGRGLVEHGWGLVIVADIARRHDGTLETAEEPGAFRTTVILPLAVRKPAL